MVENWPTNKKKKLKNVKLKVQLSNYVHFSILFPYLHFWRDKLRTFTNCLQNPGWNQSTTTTNTQKSFTWENYKNIFKNSKNLDIFLNTLC